MKTILILSILLLQSSCSLFSSNESGSYKKSEETKNNLILNLPEPWKIINNEGSDFAISNSISRSVFLFNSSCRKFEGNNLSSLATSMLSGVEIVKTVNRKIIQFQGRDALDLVVVGKVDGVERFFHILTTQKNNCIYDFVLIATSEKNLAKENSDFQNFTTRIELN